MKISLLLCILGAGLTTGLCGLSTDGSGRHPDRPAARPPEASTREASNILIDGLARSSVDLARNGGSSTRRHVSRASTPPLPAAPSIVPSAPPSPAPTPMDLQLSYALSTSCLSHLSLLLSSPTFLSCLPFSLLLTTSTSFAALVSSDDYPTLNTLLAYVSSPQPSPGQCDDFMREAYTKMGDKGACGGDLAQTQTQTKKAAGAAIEARTGLANYALMRAAAALKDPDEGVYCYLQAVESERPDDLYLWSLPAGIALPKSSKLTCSKCSSLLLNHFTAATASTAPALNSTLVNTAIGAVNSACGPAFAQYSVAPPTSGALRTTSTGVPVVVVLWLLGIGIGAVIAL